MSENSQFDEEHFAGAEEAYYHDLLLDQPGNPDSRIAPWEAEIAEGDHLRLDEQEYDNDDEGPF